MDECEPLAAGQGHAYAMNALGSIHRVRMEHEQAVEWCTKGAEAGLPTAMFDLGRPRRRMLSLVPEFPKLNSPNSAYYAWIMPNYAQNMPKICPNSCPRCQLCRLCPTQCRHIPYGPRPRVRSRRWGGLGGARPPGGGGLVQACGRRRCRASGLQPQPHVRSRPRQGRALADDACLPRLFCTCQSLVSCISRYHMTRRALSVRP